MLKSFVVGGMLIAGSAMLLAAAAPSQASADSALDGKSKIVKVTLNVKGMT